jgi:hypothetical protein
MSNKEFRQAIQASSKSEFDKLKAQYGEDEAGYMKAMVPLIQKFMQGMLFYQMLTSANDSRYAGKDVKLGTPDRPIFWYKPTRAEKYRVIYADLSVKDMTPDDVKTLPEARHK